MDKKWPRGKAAAAAAAAEKEARSSSSLEVGFDVGKDPELSGGRQHGAWSGRGARQGAFFGKHTARRSTQYILNKWPKLNSALASENTHTH